MDHVIKLFKYFIPLRDINCFFIAFSSFQYTDAIFKIKKKQFNDIFH